MAEIRDRGSVLATEEGIRILKDAKAAKRDYENKKWTYQAIADKSGLNNKTVERFFRREHPIDESSARAICQALEVDFSQVVDICTNENTSEEHKHEAGWRNTCRELLNYWKGLTTNALTTSHGVRFQLDDLFVPLGVVERRQPSRHSPISGSPEQGSELYEEKVTPISHDDFFEQVLRQRQSKHSQGSRIAIIGEPGAGKTTLLQKIGDWILGETNGMPIWIPLAAVGTKPLREYLLDDWLQMTTQELEVSQQHREELGQLLKTGKVWLLLDGVDEMAVSDALHRISDQMREGWLRTARVVLTCRLNVWDAGKNALDSFDVYRNLDFSYPTEVHQFIDNWFVAEIELQHKLKIALEQPGKERIRDMVKNPLRLTLLCHSWQLRQGDLPETKANLYEWFVDTFYEWNKGKVSFKLSTSKRKELNHALAELAKEAIDQESSRFRLQEKFINQFLGDTHDEESLFCLALQLGWLNRIGVAAENPLEDVYAFFHPTFQEYFAALAIDDWQYFIDHNPCNISKGVYRIFNRQWKEIFLLWFSRCDLAQSLKQKCIYHLSNFLDNTNNFYFYQAVFLLAEAIAEVKYSHELDVILEHLMQWSTDALENQEIHLLYSSEYIERKSFGIYHDFLGNKARQVLLDLEEVFSHENYKLTSIVRFVKFISFRIQANHEETFSLFSISEDEIQYIENLANQDSVDSLINEICSEILKEKDILAGNRKLDALVECFNLEKITNESIVINSFIDILNLHKNEIIIERILWLFGRIQRTHPDLLKSLEEYLSCKYSIEIRISATWSIFEIDPHNVKAIDTLAEIIRTNPEHLDFSSLLDDFKYKRIVSNPVIEDVLLEIIKSGRQDELLWDATWALAIINPTNEVVFKSLRFLLCSSVEFADEAIPFYMGDLLAGNMRAISLLSELIQKNKDEEIQLRLAACLTLVERENPNTGLNILANLLENSSNKKVLEYAAYYIGEFNLLNLNVTRALLKLQMRGNRELCLMAASSLNISLQSLPKQYLHEVVTGVKPYITQLWLKDNFEHYQYCCDILWYCAQNMSYQDFYLAWHNSSYPNSYQFQVSYDE